MAKPKVSLEDAVASITETFRAYGYEGASLARLSKASGLGRSSLYHHFPRGKEDMAAAASAHVMTAVDEGVLYFLLADGEPAQRLRRALGGLEDLYAGGKKSCLIELFSLSDASQAIPGTAKAMAEGLIRGFEKVAKDGGASDGEARRLAEQALIEFQGGLVVSRALSSSQPFYRALERIETALLTIS